MQKEIKTRFVILNKFMFIRIQTGQTFRHFVINLTKEIIKHFVTNSKYLRFG